LLQSMVNSVRASIGYGIRYQIILVDGGSSDGTQAWVKAQADCKLIEQGELLGAIAAFQAGFEAAQGNYVVIANDDVQFVPPALTRALVFMESTPTCGIGCFYQDRQMSWHVAEMPAMSFSGRKISVAYGQVCIIPRDLGNAAEWWSLPGAKTAWR